MQKIAFALLSLLLSTAGTLYAQENNPDRENNPNQENKPLSVEDKVFEAPPYSIGIQYRIKLGNGNILRIDLANGYDLRSFRNIDSLLTVFLTDLEAFRDSLADPLTVKHIDYLIDTSGRKKLRIRQYTPATSTFLLDGAEPSILRIRQDTIHLLIVTRIPGHRAGITVNGLRYDRLCFFVNHYSEMTSMNNRGLNAEIAAILSRQIVKRNVYNHPNCDIVEDSIVHTKVVGQGLTQLAFNAGAAVENYKNYFTPSAQVDLYVILSRTRNQYRFGLSWEPLFLFGSDAQGHLQTYRNDMIVAHYEHNHLDRPSGLGLDLDPAFSFGYVFHREGGYFTQPSFRLTAGACKIKGSLTIEPALFFNNFFRNVTPGLRLSFGGF